MKSSFCLLFSFLLSASVSAQLDSTDVGQYFDKNVVSSGMTQIKVDIGTVLFGELLLTFERMIADRWSVEVGAGMLISPTFSEIYAIDIAPTNFTGGFSLRFSSKFYYYQYAQKRAYWALRYRHREINFTNYAIGIGDISFFQGFQFLSNKKFVLDLYAGLGFQLGRSKFDEIHISDYNYDFAFIPVGLKIGYKL